MDVFNVDSEFVEERGGWSMVYDEKTGTTVFFNRETGELQEMRPKGWVKMCAERISRLESPRPPSPYF